MRVEKVRTQAQAGYDAFQQKQYNDMMTLLSSPDAHTLISQLSIAIKHISIKYSGEEWASEFIDAESRNDTNRIGDLILSALYEYRHSIALSEVES